MTVTLPCPVCGATLTPDAAICPECHTDFSMTTIGVGDSPTIVRLRAAEPVDAHAMIDDLVATLTPRFQVVRRLGQGGMGTVYLGWDPLLRRNVAIKVLTPEFAADPSAKARFIREAQAAAAVAHRNVVNIFQVGELQQTGAPYFVMQFIDGQTLDAAFPRGKPAAQSPAKRIIGEVAAALAAAHARGLVHRDIKPSNIMIEAETGRAVVLDFGISASTQAQTPSVEKLTATGVYIGTPRYMSPEQASGGDATDRSDVYSLGCVAFELLSGRAVFEESSVLGLLAAHIKDQPTEIGALRLDLDADFAALVDQCLRKRPDTRPSAPLVAKALGFAEPPTAEWPPPGLEALHANARRLWKWLTRGAVASVLLICTLASQPNLLVNERWTEWTDSNWTSQDRTLQQLPVTRYSSGGAWRDVLWGFGGTSSRLSAGDLPPGFGGTSSRLTIWEFGSTIAMVGYAVFGALLALAFLPAARDWWRGRLSGYSTRTLWRVLLSSASEPAEGNGLSAARPSDSARETDGRLVSARAFVFIASLLCILLPVAWALGVLGFDPDESWFVLSPRELLLALTPVVTLLVAAFFIFQGGPRSWTRWIPRRWRLVSTQRFATTHAEVVAAWHVRAGTAPAAPRAFNSVLQLGAIGVAVLLTITVSMSTLTTLLPSARVPRGFPDIDTDEFSPDNQVAGLIEKWSHSAVSREADPESWKSVTDHAEAIWRNETDSEEAILRSNQPLPDSVSARHLRNDGLQFLIERLLSEPTWSTPLDSATHSMMFRADDPSRLKLARRVADASTPSRWWFIDAKDSLANVRESFGSEDERSWKKVWTLHRLQRSLFIAVRLELSDGLAREARADLERAAHLLLLTRRDHVRISDAIDVGSARSFALALGELAAVERRRDESALALQMLALVGRLDEARKMRYVYRDALDTVAFALLDPSGGALQALVRDTALTLDVRADAVMDYGDAFCVSPREILLGIGPRRLQAISRAATSLEAQGYDGPWTVFARTHAAWLAGGGLSRTRIRADSSANAPFSVGEFLVRLPVLGRASHCRYFQLR